MPDGDRIHGKLGQRYQKPYKWICEGSAEPAQCANVLLKALKKEVCLKGNLPIKLAKNIANAIEIMIIKTNFMDWNQLNFSLRKIMYQSDGNHDVKELVFRSAEKILHEHRYQNSSNMENISEKILKGRSVER